MTRSLKDPWRRLAFLMERHAIDLVLDVGANVGQYAGSMRGAGYAGRIVSFEPQSAAHAALEHAARDDPAWTVAPRAAVGARAGEIAINISASSDMSSALTFTRESEQAFDGDRFIGSETAPVITVEAAIAAHGRPDDRIWLKSDTQGFEAEVLRGAAPALGRIVAVQVEASLHPVYEGQPGWRALVDMLAPDGFEIALVIPGYFSRRLGRMVEVDLVLTRR